MAKPRFNWARLYAPKGSTAALYSANHVAEAKATHKPVTDERKPPRHRRNPFARRK